MRHRLASVIESCGAAAYLAALLLARLVRGRTPAEGGAKVAGDISSRGN